MQKYIYKAIDNAGLRKTGQIEAADPKRASQILREHGFSIISISPKQEFKLPINLNRFQGISETDLVNFTRQLSTMVTAGLPLTDALNILQSQSKGPLGKVLEEVIRDIEGGSSLASAFAKHPQAFSRIYIALVRVGEAAGILDTVLIRLADNLEKQKDFHSKTKGAMVYPAIVLTVLGGVMAFMMIVIVPRFTSIYKDFGAELPAPTKMLIAGSDFMVKFWWIMLIGLIVFLVFFNRWKSTTFGQRKWDEMLFSIPLFGNLKSETLLAEFTRTLGLLASAGIPLIEALQIVSDAVDSILYKEAILEAAKQIEKGYPLYSALQQSERFPPILYKMVRVGEETGKVDELLIKLSVFFETESSNMIKNLTTALEPLIIVVLGLGVAFLIITIVLPIYQLIGSF